MKLNYLFLVVLISYSQIAMTQDPDEDDHLKAAGPIKSLSYLHIKKHKGFPTVIGVNFTQYFKRMWSRENVLILPEKFGPVYWCHPEFQEGCSNKCFKPAERAWGETATLEQSKQLEEYIRDNDTEIYSSSGKRKYSFFDRILRAGDCGLEIIRQRRNYNGANAKSFTGIKDEESQSSITFDRELTDKELVKGMHGTLKCREGKKAWGFTWSKTPQEIQVCMDAVAAKINAAYENKQK